MQREECRRVLPVLDTFGGRSLFFTSADAAAFCLSLIHIFHEGVRRGYTDGYLRKSIVADPLRRRCV